MSSERQFFVRFLLLTLLVIEIPAQNAKRDLPEAEASVKARSPQIVTSIITVIRPVKSIYIFMCQFFGLGYCG